MPSEIKKLSEQILFKPIRIEVTPVSSTAEKIVQTIYHVEKKKKTPLLIHLIKEFRVEKGLVFTRTKRDANRVSDSLNDAGIRSAAIHGNKSQVAREKALDSIKRGECRILVATDIAARGIDIDKITHVFNHDIPNIPESYVHRIGRTARAGAEGTAYSLCAPDERAYLADIERLIKLKINALQAPVGIGSGFKEPAHNPQRHSQGPTPKLNQKKRRPAHANPPAKPNNRRSRRKQNKKQQQSLN
jgi:ATP-dependent RNA helicase RhlE